jgi:hypothetical protein
MMIISKSIRLFLVAVTASVFLLATGCGGSGGGGDDGDGGFPTPTLPADAAKLDGANANEIAVAAVDFVDILDEVAELKSAESPSLPQVARLVTERIMRKRRISPAVAARTEDISADLCNPGTAIAEYEESGNSESGSVTFTGCNLDGSGVVINGSFAYVANWNDTTLDYSFHIGGSLTLAVSGESITIVMDLLEFGNEDTGAFSSNVSFSLSGIPGGGFLVTTAQPWVGNVNIGVTGGQLIVYGGDNTRLRITVTGINTATVDLDNGSGTFVFHSTIDFSS